MGALLTEKEMMGSLEPGRFMRWDLRLQSWRCLEIRKGVK
jgi:hypothetical protein